MEKILHIGIFKGTNVGDLAITESIKAILEEEYVVSCLDFNVRHLFKSGKRGGKTRSKKISKKSPFADIKQIAILFFIAPLLFFVFYRKSKGCRKVVLGGGNILMGMDYVFPIQAFCYAAFCRILKKRLYLVSVGVGPFDKAGSERLIRFVANGAYKVSVRDNYSGDLLMKSGVSREIDILPDPVLTWRLNSKRIKSHEKRYDVIISVMPLFNPIVFNDGNVKKEGNFDRSLLDLLAILKKRGMRVALLVTDSACDMSKAQSLRFEYQIKASECLDIILPQNPTELSESVSSCKVMIATRMHSAIFALANGTPVLAFNWQKKIKGLFELAGMVENVIDLEDDGGFDVVFVGDEALRLTEEKVECKKRELFINECYKIWKGKRWI